MEVEVNLVKLKHESVATNVCCSCMSQDRAILPLGKSVDLFMHLVGDQGLVMDQERMMACWECAAVLRRMGRFQFQVQYAQTVLQDMISQDTPIKPLSNLSIVKLENVDSTANYVTNMSSPYIELITDGDAKLPMVKTEIDTADINNIVLNQKNYESTDSLDNEINYDHYNIASFDDDHNVEMSAVEIKIEPELHAKTTKKKGSKKKKCLKYYKETVKRTKNPDVDLNDVESCFTSTLTESDMKNLGQSIKARKTKLEKYSKRSCMDCKTMFRSTTIKRQHVTFYHILNGESQGPFSCLECGAPCADRASLVAHWSQHRTAVKCKICGELVLWNSYMRGHAASHKYLWTCRLCTDFKVTYRSSKDFGYHYRSLHRRAVCAHCGTRHKSKKALLHHMSLRHLPPICTICRKQYKDAHGLRRHTHDTHPAALAQVVDPDSAYCVECDRRFPSASKYRLHLRTAVAHNPAGGAARKDKVPCPDCGKVFTRKSYMNNHRRQVHTKETKYYCEQCDKYLVSAWSMKKHIEGVHQKIRQPKNKICDLCGRAFQTNAVLIKHIRTHTGERPYKCAHCPAAFAQSSALKSHTRTQHKHAS